MTRMKLQLTRDRVRLQNQIECVLEEMRIKLSTAVSNLLGASGLRILQALAKGKTDPKKLAPLGDERLQCKEEQLVDAWTGRVQPVHGRCCLATTATAVDRSANGAAQPQDRGSHEAAPRKYRVWEWIQRIIAEVGAQASTFPSAAELTSWVGTCPGKEESAEQNHSSRCAKGNKGAK
jgi:transposase